MDESKLFRNQDGSTKSILNKVEGISFQENPLDFFILLARYKFACRHLRSSFDVIDVGCGHGLGSVFMSKYCKSIVGADFDSDLVAANSEQYKKISNLSFSQLNLLQLEKDQKAFDAVISMDVIEHFEEAELLTVAKNYRALTKDSGFAIIGTPNVHSRPYASTRRLETHPFEFTPEQFEDLLSTSFKKVFVYSMTDEVVSTGFNKLAWFLIAVCVP